jgi:hypothetical protein
MKKINISLFTALLCLSMFTVAFADDGDTPISSRCGDTPISSRACEPPAEPSNFSSGSTTENTGYTDLVFVFNQLTKWLPL